MSTGYHTKTSGERQPAGTQCSRVFPSELVELQQGTRLRRTSIDDRGAGRARKWLRTSRAILLRREGMKADAVSR